MGMSRRVLLGAAGLSGLAVPLAAGASGRSGGPATQDWQALAAGLDGALERPGSAGYDPARRLFDPRFDGVRPPAVARCAGPADVVEVLAFARRFGVPVVPRGGGHSYVGASTSTTGLVLDLRRLSAVGYDAATRTALIGGGARLIDVYDTLGAHKVSVPAGSCGTVGIGGITLGGGIGMGASAYGLTCDTVIAADVVTADGRHRTVDAAREPALFWALRGGGGGQFGVVTRWRMRTHPLGTVGSFVLSYPWADAAAVAAGWQARLATAPDRTWSACQFAADARGRRSVRISGFVLDGTADAEVDAIVRAIRRDPATTTVDRRAYLDVVHDRAGCDESGDCGDRSTELVGSDVFRQALPADAIAALLAAVERRARDRRPGVAKFKRMTGAVARVPVDATAFPWRGAHTMLQWLVKPAARDAATVRDAYAWIDGGHRALAKWSAGRYVNYLEPGAALLSRYYGPHLDTLRRIRAAVDPDRLFRSPYAL
ncbi:FAD-binding oxidoreductase [Actinoplanes sp. NPDC049548]|uniref:FAD-binding oxidoreductase n=1 Tax=Actinoplanes sp. NPDC049548 TaxID=3155152 RepID=UPI0034345DDD